MDSPKMSTEAPPRPRSAEELLRMSDDGFRYELVEGELRKMAPAGSEHGIVALEIGAELRNHVKATGQGRVFAAETGFRIRRDPDTVRAADVAFVRSERLDSAGVPEGYWPGAPDLAVEVISPSDTDAAVGAKVLDWLDAGARMVLVADPRRGTVAVYRSREEIRILAGDDVLDGGDVVPGWRVRVSSFFE